MKLSVEENRRLQMLYQYQILDTVPEEQFDDLTRLIAYICEVPIAAISLIDAQRQWYKSKIGFSSSEEPRGITFCNHAILQEGILIIPDTQKDQRFCNNPFVIGAAHIRFYAGAPLFAPDNVALGTLCILDHRPRELCQEQIQALGVIANQVITQLELRKNIHALKRNVERRQNSEKRLLHNAYHDALTGMPNRTFFLERLKSTFLQHKKGIQGLFAVLFLDLDRFKIINDSLGHLMGDKLLISTAIRLKSCLRDEDMLARLGGDEFVILLKHLKHSEDAVEIAHRIQEAVSNPFRLNEQEVFTSLSIGIAMSNATSYENPEDILRDADTAMYKAKELGRVGKPRYAVFNDEMHSSAVTLMHLENDLRRAIGRKELQLTYQPIVCLQSGMLIGFEALVRWKHPKRGLLLPHEFISIAEENGLIIPIGYWVISEACQQLSKWRQYPSSDRLTISVNLSSKQFLQLDLADKISTILEVNQIAPRLLKLEITETTLMSNSETALSLLNQLKGLGIEIYMDDFGTGYSSLSYLHRFPMDTLKIDKSFITHLEKDNENAKIVTTVLALAQSFGFKVIAEGIETEHQLKILVELGCKIGQGYFFCRPVDKRVAEKMFSEPNYYFRLSK